MIQFLKHRNLTVLVLLAFMPLISSALELKNGNVRVVYSSLNDGSINVEEVYNDNKEKVLITIDGGEPVTIAANGGRYPFPAGSGHATRYVRYDFKSSAGNILWKFIPLVNEDTTAETAVVNEEIQSVANEEIKSDRPAENIRESSSQPRVIRAEEPVNIADIIYRDTYFGNDATDMLVQRANNLYTGLIEAKNKTQFIIDNEVSEFIETENKKLSDAKVEVAVKAQSMLSTAKFSAANQEILMSSVIEALNNQLRKREDALSRLSSAVDDVKTDTTSASDSSDGQIVNNVIIGVIVLILILVTVFVIKKKGGKASSNRHQSVVPATQNSDGDNPAIVVRRRTTSILKKQNIDDVKDNPAYMLIQASEFTSDSAIRNIYIKNSCIKEVYNLYAEDLRNTDNPKEDGCMVLGRWVYDDVNHTYDISLEEVVFPGDDAVFKEYELNFGGKIKLRIAEKLRKLRRDTNLQYDLVCWIHSHPGLGVFFSNSDDNVQMQLKHSQHPNFLIAFVVDILTSNQEMGIFTFRQDGSMNSKGDLTRMYSLEEMYKWALQSERTSFNPDNYFNILHNSKMKIPACKGVELNNSSIIDMTQILIEPETGIVGWAVGTNIESRGAQEFVISSVVKDAEKPGAGVIGCLISVTHMSLPTIQRLIAYESANLSFVMVYSTKLMSLTTIPIINGELFTDEQYYGDVNIDELKIWTRRKR